MTITHSDIAERQRYMIRVRAWVKAAVEDGWTIRPAYGEHESVDRAASLDREGFHAMAVVREPMEATKSNAGNLYPYASLNVWGPGGMCVQHTTVYDWGKLQENLQLCQYCEKMFEGEPYRVAFADRACQTCGPKEQGELPHNWAD